MLRDEHPRAMIPKGGFNMKRWRQDGECGTVACALGWSVMLLPSFRKLYYFAGDVDNAALGPKDSGLSQYEALEIPERDFDYLFLIGSYHKSPTPKQVAKRIEKYLEDGVVPIRRPEDLPADFGRI